MKKEKTKGTKKKAPEERYWARLVREFNLKVPDDYDHKTQLALFKEKNSKDFAFFFNDMVPDSEFAETTPLVPGKTYKVKIFQMTGGGMTQDFFEFLKLIKDLDVGPQGLTLAWQLMKEKIPPDGRFIMSFTKKGAVYITRTYDSKWRFDVAALLVEGSWSANCCLLCFFEA